MFYRRERIYESEVGKSVHFYMVCPKKLTLRKELHLKIFKPIIKDGWTGTIFNEVNIVPFDQACTGEVKNFVTEKIRRVPVSREEFSEIIFNVLTNIIEKTWVTGAFHVLPHSSGYDSRLISTILKRIKERRGDSWMGDYVFIESNGESELFKKIMKMEGWNKHIVINEDNDPSEAHAHCFEFKNAWKRGNGFIGFPVNSWYSQVEWLQNKNLAPMDDSQIQGYTGYGANETTSATHKPHLYTNSNHKHAPKNNIGLYFSWHYLHQLSGFALKGNWIHPFYHLDYLRVFVKYSKGHIEHLPSGLSASSIILEHINPKLAKVHKMVTREVKKKGFFTVSDRIVNQAVKDYKSSWYGKRNPVQATKTIKYCKWWGSWFIASFCEYLLEQGHSIS